MKMKRLLAILLVMIMSLAMLGSLVGCGTKDGGDDKKTESRKDRDEDDDEGDEDDDEADEDDDEADATATPEPTPEPTPTPEPEKMPTAEELMQLNEDAFEENVKMTMTFAYAGSDGTEEVAMAMDSVIAYYENIEYQNSEVSITMMGYSDTVCQEVYYVDDEASGMRTEYSYDTENETWVKSEYAYIELDEDGISGGSSLEGLTNIEVTTDGEFYYVTAEMDGNMASELTEGMGTEGASIANATIKFKFDAKTKKVVSVDYVVQYAVEEMDGITFDVDDLVIKVEKLTEPIVIPEEVLAAESDVDVDIEWQPITGDDEVEAPAEGQYATSELPESWGGWYDEYNSKSGTFMMWDDENAEDIPITVFEKENWYFDNQYTYSLYLAVDEPSISDYGPAYEVEYSDSDAKTANPERATMTLLGRDYEQTKVLEDVIPFVCNEKQCFYLNTYVSDYTRTFVVFQDIGFDTYVEISIMTCDFESDPLTIIQKFLLDIA